MATPSRRSTTRVKARMLNEPQRFDFFQLVRLIEAESMRVDPEHNQLGDSGSPRRDPLQFRANPDLVFAAGAVESARLRKDKSTGREVQWQVDANVLGLNGASGVLPFHYSELILARLREKDTTLKAFLDHFNHRTLSLFYRAWKKYRPMMAFQTRQVSQSRYVKDWYEESVKALVGLSGLPGSFHTQPGAWMNYPGVAAHRRCNEYTLKNVIYHQFGLKVKIHQFKGKWRRLSPDVVTRMAGAMTLGMNNALGQNAILGSRCWVLQNLFEIEIEDFTEENFREFAPGSQKLAALYEFIKQRAGIEMDFDLSLMVREDRLQPIRLGSTDPLFQLGWNTRLYKARPTDKKIKIQLSKYGMQQLQANDTTPTHKAG